MLESAKPDLQLALEPQAYSFPSVVIARAWLCLNETFLNSNLLSSYLTF